MGIDVKGHIDSKFEAEDVCDVLVSMGASGVKIEERNSTHTSFHQIYFSYSGQDRVMFFHYGFGLFGSNLISLGKSGCADLIIEEIVHRFSGIYIPNDCEDGNATVYTSEASMYSQGEGIFLFKWGIANGHIQDTSVESLIYAKKKFDEMIGRNKV